MHLEAISNRRSRVNGTISGRLDLSLHSDVFSKWPLDTAECEDSDDKFQDETARNPSISQSSLVGITLFAPEATDTKGGSVYTGESDLEPSASQPLGDSTTHGHSDMDKMVVDRCRPKLATELLASCFDDPRQGRQTGSNQTKRDSGIVHRCMHRIRFAMALPLASVLMLFTHKGFGCASTSSTKWVQCSCVHQEIVNWFRPWVFRSPMEVFKLLFLDLPLPSAV